MRIDPNFRMVRLGRELRDLTQTDVAKRGGPEQTRLSRIEGGTLEPSEADVHSIATILELPESFFYEPGTPAAAPLFRKRAIRSKRKLARIQARLNAAVLIASRLLDAGIEVAPPNRFPEVGELAPDEPRRAAEMLRRDWRIPVGPVESVTELIESAGGIVLRADFGSDDASAALLTLPGDTRLWFLVNTLEDSGDRVRLSLGHELGHGVLHRLLPSIDEGETELQAFTFASALLLPPDSFDRLVPYDGLTLSEARRLKARFGVSIQAIVRAAYERKRISKARYSSLFKQISARQWRTTEPDPIPLEMPHIWPAAIDVHRSEHGFSDDAMAELAKVDMPTLGELFPEQFQRRPRLRAVEVGSGRT